MNIPRRFRAHMCAMKKGATGSFRECGAMNGKCFSALRGMAAMQTNLNGRFERKDVANRPPSGLSYNGPAFLLSPAKDLWLPLRYSGGKKLPVHLLPSAFSAPVSETAWRRATAGRRLLRLLAGVAMGIFVGGAVPAAANDECALQLLVVPNLHEGISNVLRERIDAEWHAGKYEKVFPYFYLLTRLDPQDTESYATGGWFLINGIVPKLKSGKEKTRITEYALRFWSEGLEKNKEDSTLYWELGWYWYRKEDYRRALEYLDQAERRPHAANVAVTRAHTLMKLGMKEEALAEWNKIRQEFPERQSIADKFIDRLTNETSVGEPDE
jgi:tetratricopeptide (TPR) repeat protein